MRGATRARGQDGHARAGAAGDAVEAGGGEGLGQGHRRDGRTVTSKWQGAPGDTTTLCD